MDHNFGRSNMMFLVILICAFVFLVIAGQIARAQESSSITLHDAIEIALENNIELRQSANQVSSSEVSVGQSKAVFFPT
jgi:outer membrane protein TolC